MSPIGAARVSRFSQIGDALPDSVVAQYDATTLSGLQDGDIVDPFVDNQNGMDLAANGTDPRYRADVQNGNPVVRTSDRDDILSISSSNFTTISPPMTAISVLSSVDKNSTVNRTIISKEAGTDSGGLHMIWNNSGYFEFTGGPSGGNTNAPLILTGIVDGSDTVIRENGVQTGSGTRSANMDSFALGISYDNWHANNDYCEVLLYNSNLESDGVLADEEQRLADKWGISI